MMDCSNLRKHLSLSNFSRFARERIKPSLDVSSLHQYSSCLNYKLGQALLPLTADKYSPQVSAC